MKKLVASLATLAFALGFFSSPASATAVPTNDTLPTISISGTAISVTHATWSETGFTVVRQTSGTYSTGANPRQFHDYVVACTLEPTEYRTPTTINPLAGFNCDALYNANTGGLPPTDTGAAYVGSSGSRSLLDLSNRYIGILSIYGFDSSTFYRVLTLSNSSPSSSSSNEQASIPSTKTPLINQFSSGAMVVSPGTNAILTGSRLNCTTSVSVNDKPTTFTYQTLPSGQGQLSIAMPKDLAAGKHRLSMDSCGGSVVFDNMLMVSKVPVKLELNMASGIDRGMGLVQLRAFVREHRADFNSIECVADASLSAQKRIATSLVESFCKRAMGLLASPKSHTTAIKSDNKADSILLTVTLSNK